MKSVKQSTTTMSSTKAEYIAAMEAIWIRKLIDGLGVFPTNNEPMEMYCDNSYAIIIANELGVQKGANIIEGRFTIFEKLSKKVALIF
ncbi:hypothetical protein Tco_0890751 [Tanacetum coccineum]|uniref:Uncharacterized protein n=1 Tax=Tanacetum coccineum TaxID=301880 RepID=A0ABQ5C6X9_9ASTR